MSQVTIICEEVKGEPIFKIGKLIFYSKKDLFKYLDKEKLVDRRKK